MRYRDAVKARNDKRLTGMKFRDFLQLTEDRDADGAVIEAETTERTKHSDPRLARGGLVTKEDLARLEADLRNGTGERITGDVNLGITPLTKTNDVTGAKMAEGVDLPPTPGFVSKESVSSEQAAYNDRWGDDTHVR